MERLSHLALARLSPLQSRLLHGPREELLASARGAHLRPGRGDISEIGIEYGGTKHILNHGQDPDIFVVEREELIDKRQVRFRVGHGCLARYPDFVERFDFGRRLSAGCATGIQPVAPRLAPL